MRQAAGELDDPVWTTYAAYQRAQLLSGANRARQYELAVTVADATDGRTETRGLAHLTAALASAAQGRAKELPQCHSAGCRWPGTARAGLANGRNTDRVN
jgi:hypothetical protein